MAPVTTETGEETLPLFEAPSGGEETAPSGLGEETPAPESAETTPDINALLSDLPDEEFEKLERVYRTRQSAADKAAAAERRATEDRLSRWVDQGGPQRELRTLFRDGEEPTEQQVSDVLASYGTTRDLRAVNIMHELARSELPKDYRIPQADMAAVEEALNQYRAGKGALDAVFVADMRALARAIAETEILPNLLKEQSTKAKEQAEAKRKADAAAGASKTPAPTKVGGGAPNKPMTWAAIDSKYTDSQWVMLPADEKKRLSDEANDLMRAAR